MSMQEAVGTGRLLGQFLRKLLPNDAISLDLVARADSLRLMGQLEHAEALCARVLETYPSYASAHVVRGEILRDRGDLDGAEAAWREACRLHPQHPRANLRLAQLHLNRGELSKALPALQAALLANPNAPEVARLARTAGLLAAVAPIVARPWLTEARQRALLQAAGECGCVTLSRLISRDGTIAARSYVGDKLPETAGKPAATLMLESLPMLERLGAGPLQCAVLQGGHTKLALLELDGQCLLADVTSQVPPGRVRAELQEMRAEVHRDEREGARAYL